MRPCRDVAWSLSAGEDHEPLWRRLPVLTHLAMCRHCRAFARQLRRLRALARLASSDAQPPEEFERRLVSRLAR